jgi:WD40 repeat protein
MNPDNAEATYKINEQQNPFPGLRAFGIEESHLFFGREGQSEIILEYLAQNRFAAITGASGSGKSSLIYCGLVPILYGGFVLGAGSDWNIITTHPGNQPVKNLAEALTLAERCLKRSEPGNSELSDDLAYALLRRGSFGLVDSISQMGFKKGQNILLIIDQFEELFRFKDSRDNTLTTINETEAYIKLLVNAITQRKLPVYIVITMRSDFIGECSQFQELINLINESNFLVPQMTREDFKRAIAGPLAVSSTEIQPLLVQQILNSITEGPDQLPILQHAMMRTMNFWKKYNEPHIPIRLRDYEMAGKLKNALSMHANEAYDTLSDEGKRICKRMFQTLTEKGADRKGIRHPATVKEIADIAVARTSDVIAVIDVFRSFGRSFLTPAENIPIDEFSVIDISHESLMRVWDRLKGWVEEESASVQLYLRLHESASQYQLGKTGLWRPPDLQLALSWRKNQQPSLAWAKKYNPAFEKVMVFLDASEKKFLQEEQNKVKLQRRTLNRTRRFATVMSVSALAFLGLMFYALIQRGIAIEQKQKADEYASIMEKQKDNAVEASNVKEIERLRAMHMKDSVEKSQMKAMTQLREVEEQSHQAFDRIDEVTKKSEELQKTTDQAQMEKQNAIQTAQKAIEEQSKAEKDKSIELQKRMLTIANTIALKSIQMDDQNLKGLLALQGFQFNKDYNGSANNSDIYEALYKSLVVFKGKDFNSLKGHEGAVRSLVFLPNKRIFYSAGADGKILRWDLDAPGSGPQLLMANNFSNRCLAISSNGKWLACGTGNSSIQVFSLNQPGSSPQMLEGHKGWVNDIKFMEGKDILISSSEDKSLIYWDLQSGEHHTIASNNIRLRSICISKDGKYIFGGTDDGKIIRWNIETSESITLFDNNAITIYALTLNAAGSNMAIGDKSGNIWIINTATGKKIAQAKGHTARILDISYSPDNSQLASSSFDGTIRIWNAHDLSEAPIVINEHESWVLSIAFSPDGKYLASSSNNGDLIYYWATRPNYLADLICKFLTRNLTKQEWGTYIGADIAYQKTCNDKQ